MSTSSMLPFVDLAAQTRRLEPEIRAAIDRVLAHGQFIMGPEVESLEQRLCEYSGAAAVITCANGTDALELAIRAMRPGPGDAVIVPSFTIAATAEAVIAAGAIPVFADVSPRTFNLDPSSVVAALDAAVSAGARAVGIVPVDLFGVPADYAALETIARDRGLWIVADAAQSFGASRDGSRVGSLAPLTATSFFPAKPLGCFGDGGAVLATSHEHVELLRSLRTHGSGTAKYDNVRVGRNSRLDTLQAAILLEKLRIFDDELALRQQVADRYDAGLASTIEVPRRAANIRPAWAQYTIVVDPSRRDRIRQACHERGVPTAVYYPLPLHLQTAYRDFPRVSGGPAVSERLSRTVLSLPMHPYLEKDAQAQVIDAVVGACS